MAFTLIPSMVWFYGLLILLPVLNFLNSLFAGFNADIRMSMNRRRTGGGGGDGAAPSTSTNRGNGGRFELHKAAGEGNLERVLNMFTGLSEAKRRKLLKSCDANKRTPLSCAARNNRTNVVEYLVKELEELEEPIFSEDLKDGDNDKSHPIHGACTQGHLDVLKIFYIHCKKFKLPPNTTMFAPNHHGQTILHLAAENHHVDIVKYLLTLPRGQAQKYAKDKYDRTPRDLAKSHPELVQILG